MNATPTSDLVSPFVLRTADPQQNNGRREVAFIDKGVTDYQTLAGGVRAGVEIVLLDAGQDGLAQMALWAQSHSGYDAIHVLSHGSEGTLRLGRNTVTQSSLSDAGVQAELATLGQVLTADGDLLIYGCSVAAGDAGRTFVANLAAVTGADVAASEDSTGASQLGGDWHLEYQIGIVDTDATNTTWHNVLAADVQISFTAPDLTGDDTGNDLGSSIVIGDFTFGCDGYMEGESGAIYVGSHASGAVGTNFSRLPNGTPTKFTIAKTDGAEINFKQLSANITANLNSLFDTSGATVDSQSASGTIYFQAFKDGVATSELTPFTNGASTTTAVFQDPAFWNADKVEISSASGSYLRAYFNSSSSNYNATSINISSYLDTSLSG